MAFYGVGMEVAVNKVNLNFKMHIKQKGGIGIRNLRRIFKRFDFNGNGKLDAREFEDALGSFGLFPSKIELQALMKYYDIDKDGNITYEEFMRGLRDELNDRRLAMVKKSFAIMDKDGSGQITVSDVIKIYCVNNHRDFLEGKKTKKEIVAQFLNEFDGAKGNDDGIVTWKEWVDYYTDLSMGIANDDYFIQMMESVWQIPEKEDTASYKAKIDQLTGYVKEQLLTLSAAYKNKEEAVAKLFQDFDLNMDGYLTIDELTAMVAKLKISMERKMATGVFRNINQSNSGAISAEEFTFFVLS